MERDRFWPLEWLLNTEVQKNRCDHMGVSIELKTDQCLMILGSPRFDISLNLAGKFERTPTSTNGSWLR